MPILLKSIIVFVFKTFEVTLTSLKVIFVTRRKRLLSAICAMIETAIWALIVSSVIDDIKTQPAILIAYCLGNAVGYFLGSVIEEKIALGTVNIQVVTEYSHRNLVENMLKEMNIGYSVTVSEGVQDTNCDFMIITKRKNVDKIIQNIKKNAPNSFVSVTDVVSTVGGH